MKVKIKHINGGPKESLKNIIDPFIKLLQKLGTTSPTKYTIRQKSTNIYKTFFFITRHSSTDFTNYTTNFTTL